MKRIALGGATQAVLNIAAFGPTYDSGFLGDDGPVFRRGPLLARMLLSDGNGMALGRNLIVIENSGIDPEVRFHEYTHYLQQGELGFGEFYGRIMREYIQSHREFGDWARTYSTPGHLEYQSTVIENFYRDYFIRRPR